MKKFSKIALAVGLLGSAMAANAADKVSNVIATATVNVAPELTATYTPGAPLLADNLKAQQIGTITLTGYNGTPYVTALNLSDAEGNQGYLKLNDAAGNSLKVEAFIDGNAIKLNGAYGGGTQAIGTLPAVTTNIDLKTLGSQEDIPAGEYTDSVTITLANQ